MQIRVGVDTDGYTTHASFDEVNIALCQKAISLLPKTDDSTILCLDCLDILRDIAEGTDDVVRAYE